MTRPSPRASASFNASRVVLLTSPCEVSSVPSRSQAISRYMRGEGRTSCSRQGGRGQPFEVTQGAGDLLLRKSVVLQAPREVRVVGAHVEVAVAGEVKEDSLRLAFLLAAERFVDDGFDGVSRFGRRDD